MEFECACIGPEPSKPAGTGVKSPEQYALSCWEIQTVPVSSYRPAATEGLKQGSIALRPDPLRPDVDETYDIPNLQPFAKSPSYRLGSPQGKVKTGAQHHHQFDSGAWWGNATVSSEIPFSMPHAKSRLGCDCLPREGWTLGLRSHPLLQSVLKNGKMKAAGHFFKWRGNVDWTWNGGKPFIYRKCNP